MSGLLAALPQPKRAQAPVAAVERTGPTDAGRAGTVHGGGGGGGAAAATAAVVVPVYGARQGFVPRRAEDFGSGGAFPELPGPQYPLGMGLPGGSASSGALTLAVDAGGEVRYDAIVGGGDRRVAHSHSELVPKVDRLHQNMPRPSRDEEKEVARRTAAALEKRVQSKLSAAQPTTVAPKAAPSQFIKYTPATNITGAEDNTRIIKMVEAPRDPFEPPKFRHKRVPRGPGSPPVPVMHSPPRKPTAEEHKDWKIPPCVSNWKNAKGFTIPLDKRLAADGRGLQDVSINDNFAKLSESLYVAEQTARKAVEMRSKMQRELMVREKEKKEETLRELAQKARMERAGAGAGVSYDVSVGGNGDAGMGRSFAGERDAEAAEDRRRGGGGGGRDAAGVGAGGAAEDDYDGNTRLRETEDERRERRRREEIREERRKEREQERRLEAKGEHLNKKSKITRDRDRDVSERIALGQANIKSSGEAMYDQRLFNQDGGIGSGLNQDDAYNVYDKALFASKGSNLYRPKAVDDGEMYGGGAGNDEEGLLATAKFKPDKGFSGAEGRGGGGGGSAGPRTGPVEFEADADDPFGLNDFMTEVNTGKRAMENIGSRGTMHASG